MATSETTLGPDPGTIARVAPPAPGGTLQEMVAHLAGLGEPCASTAAGSEAWVQYPRGVLLRFPLDRAAPVAREACSALLRERGVWLLNYLVAPDEGHRANCVHYVCRDGAYDLQKLDRQARQNVRRGLKTFELRLCSWDEWAREGFQAYAETEARHGYDADRRAFTRLTERWRRCPLYEVWGAWQGAELAAWLTVLKVDDWAMVDLVRARTTALPGRPNNALLYLAGRHALVEERRRYVTLGTSSLQVGAGEQSMHRYELDMGYEAVPVHRVFVARPIYRPALDSRAMSWAWDRLSRTFPRSAPLRKVAGMARLLSGRAGTQVLERPAQE
jgi:hypothetical protein